MNKLSKIFICIMLYFSWYCLLTYHHELLHKAIAGYFGVPTTIHYYFLYGYCQPTQSIPHNVSIYLNLVQSLLDIATFTLVYLSGFLLLIFILVVLLHDRATA